MERIEIYTETLDFHTLNFPEKNDCGKPAIFKFKTRITGTKLGDAVNMDRYWKCKNKCKNTQGCVAIEYKWSAPKSCQVFSAVQGIQKDVNGYASGFCTDPGIMGILGSIKGATRAI